MIEDFVKRWDENKENLRKNFLVSHPESYKNILERLISEVINPNQEDYMPRMADIETNTFGDWEGTQVFIIPENSPYPHTFWVTKVYYGSCSGCDTLQMIESESNYNDEGDPLPPNEKQVDGYMTLALHMLQRMKEV